jgi:RimJ/RimL family protein N-acetyltransferase
MRGPAEREIVLRRAAMTDAERLYRWRTDPETCAASLHTGPIEFESHCAWLVNSLDDPNRQIYVAEYRGEPIGTVRADKVDSGWRLSWTVAPEFRARGFGIQMVQRLAASISGSLEAVMKPGNAASIAIAKSLGMRFDTEQDGILRFFCARTAPCAASASRRTRRG